MLGKGNIPKWNICVCIVCFNVIFISGSNVIFQLLRVHISTLCLWYWFFFHSDMGWWRLHKRHSRSRLWFCAGSGLGAGSVGLCAESFNRWVLCVSSSQGPTIGKKRATSFPGSFLFFRRNQREPWERGWGNSRYLATPPLVSPRNDVWGGTGEEIPYRDDVSLTRSG